METRTEINTGFEDTVDAQTVDLGRGESPHAPGLAAQFQRGSVGLRPQPGAGTPSGIRLGSHDVVHLLELVSQPLLLGELVLFQGHRELFVVFYGIGVQLMEGAIGVEFLCVNLQGGYKNLLGTK